MGTTQQQRPDGDAKALQERLHELISRVVDGTDVIKSWPESEGDDASIHVKRTSKLINTIREISKAIERVEGVAKKDEALWKKLQECKIPLDLLELLDCSNGVKGDLFGLNPELFVRGLLREALSQLAGLRRRKVALEMLGNAIQAGLDNQDTPSVQPVAGGTKRERSPETITVEPSAKRQHT